MRWRRTCLFAALALAVLAGLWALAGFVLAPNWLAARLTERFAAAGVELRVARITVNPFTGVVRLGGVRAAFDDAGRRPARHRDRIAADGIAVRVAPVSAVRWRWIFDSLDIDRLSVHWAASPDATHALLAALAGATEIRALHVAGGRASLGWRDADGVRVPAIEAVGLSLDYTPRRIAVELRAAGGGRVRVRGVPWPARWVVDASGIDVRPWSRALRLPQSLRLDSARLDADLAVARVAGVLRASGRASAHGIVLADADGRTVLDVPSLVLEDVAYAADSGLRLGRIEARAPHWQVARGSDQAPPAALALLGWLTAPGGPWDAMAWSAGRVTWRDASVSPAAELSVSDWRGAMRAPRDGQAVPGFTAWGAVGEAGVELEGGGSGISAAVVHLPLALIEPYARAVLGRPSASGELSLTARWDAPRDTLESTWTLHRWTPERPRSAEADDRLDWFQALTEDPAGDIRAELRLARPWRRAPLGALRAAFAAHLREVTADPLATLADLAGAPPAALAAVVFAPGEAGLSDAMLARLERLAGVMARRPGIAFDIVTGADPAVDGAALARQQVLLHVALAASAGRGAADAVPALDDPKITAVLDEFRATRLPPEAAARLDAAFGGAQSGRGPGYYAQLLELLVEHETVSPAALRMLARFRGHSVIGALRKLGVGAARVRARPASGPISAVPDGVPALLQPRPAVPAAAEAGAAAPGPGHGSAAADNAGASP